MLVKGGAVFLGVLAAIMGFLTAVSLSAFCIVGGVFLIAAAVIVLALEVPICFSMVQFLQPVTRFSEGRPHWQKVALYMILPIIAMALCQSVTSVFGSLCIFGVAALYFMLTVGKKAPLEDMRNRASDSKSNLTNEQQPR